MSMCLLSLRPPGPKKGSCLLLSDPQAGRLHRDAQLLRGQEGWDIARAGRVINRDVANLLDQVLQAYRYEDMLLSPGAGGTTGHRTRPKDRPELMLADVSVALTEGWDNATRALGQGLVDIDVVEVNVLDDAD